MAAKWMMAGGVATSSRAFTSVGDVRSAQRTSTPRACAERFRAFAIRVDIEIGSDDSAALAGQLGHHRGADEAECPGDENTIIGHEIPLA